MQLRIFGIHQFHFFFFGNCGDPFEDSFSTFFHLVLYEKSFLKGSPFLYLVGDPEQMFPYRDQQEGN